MFMIRLVVALEPETFMQLNDGRSKLMYSYPATGINIILGTRDSVRTVPVFVQLAQSRLILQRPP